VTDAIFGCGRHLSIQPDNSPESYALSTVEYLDESRTHRRSFFSPLSSGHAAVNVSPTFSLGSAEALIPKQLRISVDSVRHLRGSLQLSNNRVIQL